MGIVSLMKQVAVAPFFFAFQKEKKNVTEMFHKYCNCTHIGRPNWHDIQKKHPIFLYHLN